MLRSLFQKGADAALDDTPLTLDAYWTRVSAEADALRADVRALDEALHASAHDRTSQRLHRVNALLDQWLPLPDDWASDDTPRSPQPYCAVSAPALSAVPPASPASRGSAAASSEARRRHAPSPMRTPSSKERPGSACSNSPLHSSRVGSSPRSASDARRILKASTEASAIKPLAPFLSSPTRHTLSRKSAPSSSAAPNEGLARATTRPTRALQI